MATLEYGFNLAQGATDKDDRFYNLEWMVKNPRYWADWPYLVVHRDGPEDGSPYQIGIVVVGRGPVVFYEAHPKDILPQPLVPIETFHSYEALAEEWYLW